MSHPLQIGKGKKKKSGRPKEKRVENKQNNEQERLTERAVINGIQTVQIPKQMELRNPTRA